MVRIPGLDSMGPTMSVYLWSLVTIEYACCIMDVSIPVGLSLCLFERRSMLQGPVRMGHKVREFVGSPKPLGLPKPQKEEHVTQDDENQGNMVMMLTREGKIVVNIENAHFNQMLHLAPSVSEWA